MLASWLFTQYLLTSDVQISYSETEGYVPVTSKAQESDEYQDYLAREGEDTDTHYKVKIEAAKLLLNHTQDTFTTPVFSGSASLRDASGQLIEKTAKSVRRKENVNEAYMDKLFDDVTALYHLNDTLQSAAGKQDLGHASDDLRRIAQCAWRCLGIDSFVCGLAAIGKKQKRGLIFRTFRL